jgi:hypothetical protein
MSLDQPLTSFVIGRMDIKPEETAAAVTAHTGGRHQLDGAYPTPQQQRQQLQSWHFSQQHLAHGIQQKEQQLGRQHHQHHLEVGSSGALHSGEQAQGSAGGAEEHSGQEQEEHQEQEEETEEEEQEEEATETESEEEQRPKRRRRRAAAPAAPRTRARHTASGVAAAAAAEGGAQPAKAGKGERSSRFRGVTKHRRSGRFEVGWGCGAGLTPSL